MVLKKVVFPAPLVQQLFDINLHDTVSFLSANSPNVLFSSRRKMPVSRVRSHQLPQNEDPHRGAKTGLAKHTERMRSLARTEGGRRDMCMGGSGIF